MESVPTIKKGDKFCSLCVSEKKWIAKLAGPDRLNFNDEFDALLDVTMSLDDGSFKPYSKPNKSFKYIDNSSNDPPVVLNNLPKMIQSRMSKLSSCEKISDKHKGTYEHALRSSRFKAKLEIYSY